MGEVDKFDHSVSHIITTVYPNCGTKLGGIVFWKLPRIVVELPSTVRTLMLSFHTGSTEENEEQ